MPNDYPFYEIAVAVKEYAEKGFSCYQKFTCSACGQRLTMEEPNVLYKEGHCDKCGHITNIEKQGCNYMLHMIV